MYETCSMQVYERFLVVVRRNTFVSIVVWYIIREGEVGCDSEWSGILKRGRGGMW